MAIDNVLKNAEWSQKVWQNALNECSKLSRFFHLRACSDKITVVSTHPDKPMNGCNCSKATLLGKLKELAEAIGNNNINGALLAGKGFERKGTEEDSLQAQLINDINAGEANELKKALDVKELRFVASELILYQKGDERRLRPDVVALGDGKIYVIEMKAPGKKGNAVEQARKYVEYYRPKVEFYALVNLYLRGDMLAPGKTELVGVGMYGYKSNTAPVKDIIHGVCRLDYRKV